MPNTKFLVTQEMAKSYIFLPKWRNFIKLVTLAATDSTDVQVFQGLGVICSCLLELQLGDRGLVVIAIVPQPSRHGFKANSKV